MMCSLPFSLKVLWSPFVDLYYFKSFGRRKSWIIPTQVLVIIWWLNSFRCLWCYFICRETLKSYFKKKKYILLQQCSSFSYSWWLAKTLLWIVGLLKFFIKRMLLMLQRVKVLDTKWVFSFRPRCSSLCTVLIFAIATFTQLHRLSHYFL